MNDNFEKLLPVFKELEDSLKIEFKNKELLVSAFIHRSFLNENEWMHLPHNERLEFLGDAVLELVVTQYLYSNYPKEDEGTLTTWRSALVNSVMLAKKSNELKFEEFLLLSKGEQKDTGKSRMFILANVFESYIGALFLDQGIEPCRKLIESEIIAKELHTIIKDGSFIDAKSHFQEKAQEIEKITPVYKVLDEWGPDHDKHFKVGLYLGEEEIASGEGMSKKEAEEEAAKAGFRAKGWKWKGLDLFCK